MPTDSYPCLSVVLPLAGTDDLADFLVELGATAVEQRDAETLSQTDSNSGRIIAGFPDAETRDRAKEKLEASGLELQAVCSLDVKDDGWSTRWRDFHQPVVLGRLEVVAPWHELPPTTKARLVIDPGQAFGTGGHATTQLILQLLESRRSMPPRVLDVGCGSGVLGIAAIELGAGHATSVDIETESVEATLENAATNGVQDRLRVVHGTAGDLDGVWPLVLANLELRIFLDQAADIAARVERGGEAILSGLLEEQVQACLDLWPGFELVARRDQDGWSAMSLVHRP